MKRDDKPSYLLVLAVALAYRNAPLYALGTTPCELIQNPNAARVAANDENPPTDAA